MSSAGQSGRDGEMGEVAVGGVAAGGMAAGGVSSASELAVRAARSGRTGPMLSRRQLMQAGAFGAAAAFLAACGASKASPSGAAASQGASAAASAASVAPSAAGGTGTIRVGVDIGAEKQQQWLPWHNFGQDYGLQWCAQKLVSVGADGTRV